MIHSILATQREGQKETEAGAKKKCQSGFMCVVGVGKRWLS
jgi:hypothetical protein